MAIAATKRYISPQQRIYYGGMVLFAMIVGVFFLPPDLFIRGGFFAASSVLFFTFLFNIRWGLYAMAAFCFFSNWFVYLSNYEWAKNIAYLSSVDAPLIDFIAMVVAFSFAVALFLQIEDFDGRPFRFISHSIWAYAAFIACGVISALQAYDGNIGASFKAIARPMVFVFVLYALLPLALIRTKELFNRVLQIWFGVGVAIALFGLSSLVVVPQTGWWMVTPYGINNLAPLGYNHNLIAEVLVPIIPVGAWFAFEAYRAGASRRAWWYVVGTSVIMVAELLTLSRAGWLSVVVQTVLLIVLFRPYLKDVLKKGAEYVIVFFPVLIAMFLIYMLKFLAGSSAVSGSNFARLLVAEITQFYFFRSPWIGYGPGMYIPIFENTQDYVREFGQALEAHGMIQKIFLETGVLGAIPFFGTLALIMRTLWKGARSVGHRGELVGMLFIMVAGALTFQLFNTSYFTSVMWMPIGVALSGAYLYSVQEDKTDHNPHNS